MYSFKFYYLEACDNLKLKSSEKLLSKIEESTNATSLDLSTIELTDDICKAIGHALRKDVFLQELDLSNCMLSDDGLSNILSGLETNKFILTLNLKGNNIRSAGTAVIGKLLRHNNHLQNLYLEWNNTGIFPEKFSYLCEGLSVNKSLKLLDLRNNQLNHICAQSISDVICRNSTLQKLDLRWNSIGLIGGRTILKSLAKNKSLLKLDITGNDVPLEIQKSIELITSITAERSIKNSESMEKTKFFLSKLQNREVEQDKQVRTLIEQLERKDKDNELNQRWSSTKLTQLQETIKEKDNVVEDLLKKLQELQRKVNIITEERNNIVLTLNEIEIKNKEMKKEFHFLLDKERKEKEDTERKFIEEIGTTKEENLHLKQKIQELKIMLGSLDEQTMKLKSTIAKMEKMSKLEERSFQEQISTLNERHEENVRELNVMRKNEIARIKEEFAEIENNLRQRVTYLEREKNDLEGKMIEKDALIMETQAEAEKMVDELKKKAKIDEDKLRKQMEERIQLLEASYKKQDELLKEQLEAMYEIKKKTTENDLLLAEETHRTHRLQHLLDNKDAEMNACVAKVKLEVKEQLEELNQIKTSLNSSYQENATLKEKMEEIKKQHIEEINNKEKEVESLKHQVEQLRNKMKEILQNMNKQKCDLQSAFDSYMNSMELATNEEADLDKLNSNT